MVVLDASVAVLAYGDDPLAQSARALMTGTDWRCPDIFLGECANSLARMVRTQRMTAEKASDAFDLIERLTRDRTTRFPVVAAAFRSALALNHSVFDCIYLETARVLQTTVVTVDRRFARKLGSAEEPALIVHLADWRP